MKWYVDILKKYRCFNGRSQRWEFWMFQFTNYLIIIPLIGPIVVLIFLVSDSEPKIIYMDQVQNIVIITNKFFLPIVIRHSYASVFYKYLQGIYFLYFYLCI
jgi:uncharacterized membrane protein YhaH (DUF805 family)